MRKVRLKSKKRRLRVERKNDERRSNYDYSIGHSNERRLDFSVSGLGFYVGLQCKKFYNTGVARTTVCCTHVPWAKPHISFSLSLAHGSQKGEGLMPGDNTVRRFVFSKLVVVYNNSGNNNSFV